MDSPLDYSNKSMQRLLSDSCQDQKLTMKIILVFFTALMLLLSCKKSNNRQPSDLPVQGNWELRQSIGGLVGIQNFAPGNGNILELHADKTFKFVYPDSQFTTGKYQAINIISTNKNLLHLDFDSTSYTD